MPDVTSAAGDCFCRIAKTYGFFNYHSVYDYEDNATRFPTPNHLEEGSTVKVPEKKMKAFDLPLDKEKKFKIIRKKTMLRIRVCRADADQTPKINKAGLDIGGKKSTATKGLMEVEDIDPLLTAATLTVVLADPPSYSPPPATAKGKAKQYPPAIDATEFDDAKTVWPKQGETIVWSLQVGSLEPHKVTRGVLQRLENLGFTCPVQQVEDDATRKAVKTYRRAVEGKASPADTDAVADIRDHIQGRHNF